jgi:hypothetical protein
LNANNKATSTGAGIYYLLAEDPDYLEGLAPFELESLAFEFHLYAAATPMTAEEYVAYQLQRAGEAREKILADPAAPPALVVAAADAAAWGAGWLAALRDAELLRPEDEPPGIRETPQFASLMAVVSAGMLGTEAGSEVRAAGNLTDFFAKVRQWYGDQPNAYGSAAIRDRSRSDLHLSSPTHFEAFTIQVGERDLVGRGRRWRRGLRSGHRAAPAVFGQPSTLLAGLLFVSHEAGTLSMVDLASMQSVVIASGGTRGEPHRLAHRGEPDLRRRHAAGLGHRSGLRRIHCPLACVQSGLLI